MSTLIQEFQEIHQKLDNISQRLATIEGKNNTPNRIPFKLYCKGEAISRPTGYKRAERGLITLEKIGGRQYVRTDLIKVTNRYERT